MNQRAFSGFLFALLAAAMWGALPIGLQQVLKVMDPQTIVWYRFAVAGFGLLLILAGKRTLPDLKRLHRRYVLLIFLNLLFLLKSSLKSSSISVMNTGTPSNSP